jgi:LuxR family maltose regulon positive regulatory protein
MNVLILLSYGLTNKEISERLHISVHTTKAHLESIYDKLEVTNRLQAVVRAVFIGIIDVNEILVKRPA